MPSVGFQIGIDGEAKFRASITNIAAAMKALDAQMKNVKASFSEQDSAETKNAKILEQLIKQLDALEKAQAKAKQNVEDAAAATGANSTVTNRARAQYEELSARINETRNEIHDLTSTVDEGADSMDDAADAAAEYAQTLATIQAAEKIQNGLKKVGEALKSAAESSIDFESAFTGVRRAVRGTPEELESIEASIKALAADTGVSAEEIASVVTSAGRLGVATDSVMEFSRVMIDLGEASSMSADEAATALARFTNILGTAPEDISRLGSTLLKLGNSFATNETEITEMATRLASAGKLAGFTETQILGLATAMSSVGINAEAGGTAMTQTITAITRAVGRGGDALDTFARVSGMSAEEFATAWRTDASGALQAFVQGLANVDANGGNVTATLDSLGLSGIRQSNMLRSLALAADMLNDTLDTANDAWAKNTELTETAGLVYNNTEHRIASARESLNNLSIAVGDAFGPQIRGAADMINGLAESLTQAAENAPELVSAMGTVTAGVTAATAAFVALKGATAALSAIGVGVAALAPWAAVGAAVGLIASEATKGAAAWNEYVDSMTPAATSAEETAAEIERLEAEINTLQDEWNSTDWGFGDGDTNYYKEIAWREDAIEGLRQKLADYATQQTGTTVAVDENTVAVALAAEKEQEFQDVMSEVTELLQKQQERYEGLRESYAKTFGLFETAPEHVQKSVDDMLSAWGSQQTYWEELGANMQAAAKMGLDDGLLQSLSDLGPEGASAVASILGEIDKLGAGTDEAKQRIDEINERYRAQQEAQEKAARETADAISEASGEIEKIMEKTSEAAEALDKTDEMYSTAKANIEAYLKGLEAQAGPMYEAVEDIGRRILASMQAGVNSGSLQLPGVIKPGGGASGGIPGFATGLDYVPYDNFLAYLHKGEMVLPADDAADYRSGSSTGGRAGTVINIYPQKLDDATMDYIYNRFSVQMGADA